MDQTAGVTAQNFSLDLSSLNENATPEAWAEKAAELDKILKTFGFLWIENHGILPQTMEQLTQACRTFFDLPKEAKQAFQKPKNTVAYHGYNAMKDLTGDRIYREYFHYWPHAPINYGPEVDRITAPFYSSIRPILPQLGGLAQKILKLFGILLEVGENFFLENHKGLQDFSVANHSYLAAINYPPMDDDIKMPQGKHRMGQHTDWDSFSLLLIDPVGGLEAQTRDGEWMKCDRSPNTGEGQFGVLMILGEYMETWSRSRYIATNHRVPIPENGDGQKKKPRLGLPYFVHPDNPTTIEALVWDPNAEDLPFTSYAAGDYFETQFSKVAMKAQR